MRLNGTAMLVFALCSALICAREALAQESAQIEGGYEL